MNALRGLYARLDRGQRSFVFRLVASIVIVIGGLGTTAWLGFKTTSITRQYDALIATMAGQNLQAGDPVAVTLLEQGTVTVNGRTYGGPQYTEVAEQIFDGAGNIAAASTVASAMLADQRPPGVPSWMLEHINTTVMLGAVLTGWLLLVVWMGLSVPFLLTVIGTALAVSLGALVGRSGAMWALGGIGLLTFTFVLLMRAFSLLYARPNQVLAVAHTVLKEAARTRIPLVFIIIILVLLPLLPLGLDPDAPLRYRLQTFISRSLGFTFYLAACMTIFLSCASVAFEIRDRQIWQLVTKPVSRLSYLLGKWLGVITVNFVIMAIAGVSIFTYIQYLREQPVRDSTDIQIVEDAVLTARVGRKPDYPQLTNDQIRARVDEVISRTPEYALMEAVPPAVKREIAKEIITEHATAQRSIPPLGGVMSYTFSGLEGARESGHNLTLRYRFHIWKDDEHMTFKANFRINGEEGLAFQRTYVPTMAHVFALSPEWIREDGTITIEIQNPYEPTSSHPGAGSLNFDYDGFELLYRAASFESNYVRAVMLDWVKLSFLGMLGLCCATFLSFPVACLTSFTIFIAGTIGPFLARSLQEYYPPPLEAVDWGNMAIVLQWAFQTVIRNVAQAIVFVLDAFGSFRPTQSLVDGRLIPWGSVFEGVMKLGVIWSGLSLLIGYLVLRKRQLAIYSGHG